MDSPSLTLRRADESGIEYVETALRRNGLPSADVSSKPGCFYIGYGEDAAETSSNTVSDDTSAAADAPSSDTSAADAVSDDTSAADAAQGNPVCVGGLEREGPNALLRSVVVEESARGRGYGSLLCDRLESRAAADGVEAIYLLTTTAADFFADRGYEPVERADAPDAIRDTTEFAELCPETATCMRKTL